MLMYQKSMFDRYYCIKHIFSFDNFGENASKISFFRVPILARKGTSLPANVLQTSPTGQSLRSCGRYEITFATVHVTDDEVSFSDGPGMLVCTCKTAKRALTAHVYGFVSVKAWLLRQ